MLFFWVGSKRGESKEGVMYRTGKTVSKKNLVKRRGKKEGGDSKAKSEPKSGKSHKKDPIMTGIQTDGILCDHFASIVNFTIGLFFMLFYEAARYCSYHSFFAS